MIQDKKRIAYLGKRKPKKGKPVKGNKKSDGGAGQKLAFLGGFTKRTA